MPHAVAAASTTSRARRAAIGMLAALCVAVTLVAGWPAEAFAAKPSTTAAIAKAQQQLDQLNIASEKAVEAYDQAQNAFAAASARLAAQQKAVANAKLQLTALQEKIRGLAVLEYESGGTTPLIALLVSGDPQTSFRRVDLLAQVNRYHEADLVAVAAAAQKLEQSEKVLAETVAAQRKALGEVSARKAAVERLIAKQQALLASLHVKAQQEDAAARAAAQAAAQAAARQYLAAPRVSRSAPRVLADASQPSDGGAAPPVPSGSGAAAALAFAYAQLGKPYVFGGAGPYGYDCSGLTMRAWQAAGVQLSHSAEAQRHEGRPIPLSAVQPGDLIFWGIPAWHVAIYIGGGRVITAPHTGTVVQIQSIWGSPSGAVRP